MSVALDTPRVIDTTNRLAVCKRALIRRAHQRAEAIFTARCEDVTPMQFDVLAATSVRQPATQTDIVNATGIDRSTLSDIMERLVAKGYIVRKRDPDDRRAYRVRLSRHAMSRLPHLWKIAVQTDEELTACLSKVERIDLHDMLSRVVTRSDE